MSGFNNNEFYIKALKDAIDYYKNVRSNIREIAYYYNKCKRAFIDEPNKNREVNTLLEDIFPCKCPPIGTGFIGYKILKAKRTIINLPDKEPMMTFSTNLAKGPYVHQIFIPALAELYIPDDAKRSSAFGNKCRCDRCIVKKISVVNDSKLQHIQSASSPLVRDEIAINYVIGEDIFVDNFDNDRWNECSSGIHFFTKLDDALDYFINIMLCNVFRLNAIDEFLSWFKKNKYE